MLAPLAIIEYHRSRAWLLRIPGGDVVKQKIINSLSELSALQESVTASATATLERLHVRLASNCGLPALALLRFDASGCDPLDPQRSLNFIEQLNQSFTYLATIEAVRWLFERQPSHAPYVLNLGTAPGSDIISKDGAVAAETFAATHPDSNRKLGKDVAKVRAVDARYRYVFYLSRVEASSVGDSDVTVVRLNHSCLNDRSSDA